MNRSQIAAFLLCLPALSAMADPPAQDMPGYGRLKLCYDALKPLLIEDRTFFETNRALIMNWDRQTASGRLRQGFYVFDENGAYFHEYAERPSSRPAACHSADTHSWECASGKVYGAGETGLCLELPPPPAIAASVPSESITVTRLAPSDCTTGFGKCERFERIPDCSSQSVPVEAIRLQDDQDSRYFGVLAQILALKLRQLNACQTSASAEVAKSGVDCRNGDEQRSQAAKVGLDCDNTGSNELSIAARHLRYGTGWAAQPSYGDSEAQCRSSSAAARTDAE